MTPHPDFAPAAVDVERRPDGSLLLRSPHPLPTPARQVGEWARRWADETPASTFLAERTGEGGWRRLDHASARRATDSLSDLLLELGLGPDRPLAVLSENGIDHALLSLAAMQVGVPVAPLSPAYSLLATDRGRLRAMLELITPGAIYVDDGELYAEALADAAPRDTARLWSLRSTPGPAPSFRVADHLQREASGQVEAAFGRVGPDSVAKLLFTSGSTGTPKAVITTQRMLCSNQSALQAVWPSLLDRGPVLVDWLPWSHCFGGSFNFNMALANGGALYVDRGKPTPDRHEATLANLAEISPTHYFNVPRGFAMLVPALEADSRLAENFFSQLELIFYAAAALPQDLWQRLERLAARHAETPPRLVSAWGSTETAPMAAAVHFGIESARVVGLPVPGTELLLVPSAGKREVRVRGPQVTPGYWKNVDQTLDAFDTDGFYRIGDALTFLEEEAPEKGLTFDGRVAEDFKLSSGSWVSVGTLRPEFLAHAGAVVADAVICGHDRDAIGALCIPDPAGVARLTGEMDPGAGLSERLAHPAVREALAQALARHNQANPHNRARIECAAFLAEPLSIDNGEITDKGYVNQRAVREARPERVAELFGDGATVIRPARAAAGR